MGTKAISTMSSDIHYDYVDNLSKCSSNEKAE